MGPQQRWVLRALVVLGAGGLGAWLIWASSQPADPTDPADGPGVVAAVESVSSSPVRSSSTSAPSSSTTTTTRPAVPTSTTVPAPLLDGCGLTGPARPEGTFEVVTPAGGQRPDGYSYRVSVEAGLPVDPDCFAAAVREVLSDRRSWGAAHQVKGTATVEIRLASPATTDRLCAPLRTNGIFSCRNGRLAVLNWYRWREGAASYGSDLASYRIYMVNHEVGHVLGHIHQHCPAAGAPAPVMMQQTKGVGECEPNPWPQPPALVPPPRPPNILEARPRRPAA